MSDYFIMRHSSIQISDLVFKVELEGRVKKMSFSSEQW